MQSVLVRRFDYIWAARQPIARTILPALKAACPEAPIIFDTVDLHFLREARYIYSVYALCMLVFASASSGSPKAFILGNHIGLA